MTKIKLTCKHSKCVGTGKIPRDKNHYSDYDLKDCPGCDSGKTVMEFEYRAISNHFDQVSGDYAIKNLMIPSLVKWDGERYQKRNWNIFNPIILEIIEEQECPKCGGKGKIENYVWPMIGDSFLNDCPNCTDGKVEVVTFKVIFGEGER